MGFINWIDQIDKSLFFILNSFHNEWMDPIFFGISGKLIWIPFYLFLIYLIIKVYRKKSWIFIITIFIAVGSADFTCSSVLKPGIERLRPSRNPEISSKVHIVNNYKGGLYGFASSHAANTFAIATFLFLILRKKINYLSLLFLWAAIVSYSRIYLGVHYPGDIIAGAAIGVCWSFLYFKLTQKFILKI